MTKLKWWRWGWWWLLAAPLLLSICLSLVASLKWSYKLSRFCSSWLEVSTSVVAVVGVLGALACSILAAFDRMEAYLRTIEKGNELLRDSRGMGACSVMMFTLTLLTLLIKPFSPFLEEGVCRQLLTFLSIFTLLSFVIGVISLLGLAILLNFVSRAPLKTF